jgi:hypothetical protein
MTIAKSLWQANTNKYWLYIKQKQVKKLNQIHTNDLNTFSYQESVLIGGIVFAESDKKSTYVIRSNDAPSWRTVLMQLLTMNDDDDDDSILYFNVLTQQLREPITESAQDDKIIRTKLYLKRAITNTIVTILHRVKHYFSLYFINYSPYWNMQTDGRTNVTPVSNDWFNYSTS